MSIGIFYTDGFSNHIFGKVGVQFYWPSIKLTKMELHLRLHTNVRVFVNRPSRYYGIGIEILGFGMGVQYDGSAINGSGGQS